MKARFFLALILSVLSVMFIPAHAAKLEDIQAAYESASSMKLDIWKFQFPAGPGGEKVDLDDSAWQTVDNKYQWWGDNNQAWYRQSFVVPEKIGGIDTTGRRLTLKIGVDDDGDVFINGSKVTSFHWDQGSVVLTEHAKPGEKLSIAVYAKNNGQPGQLMFARIEIEDPAGVISSFGRYVAALRIASSIAPNLDGKAQTAIRSSMDAVDLDAAKSGDLAKLEVSLQSANKLLDDAGSEIKQLRCHLVSNAHIDMAWLWPWTETVDVCRNTFKSVLNLMEEYPELKYSQSQAHAYMWMEQYEPEMFKKIQQRVKEGRWEIVGGMWVEPDCNLPSGEGFVRQLLYGKRYFKEKFGVDVKIGWNPDSFGYNWNLPQIYKKAGVDCFITQKLGWNDTTRFPYNIFRWRGPDGTEIIGHQCFGSYGENVSEGGILDQQMRAKACGVNDMMHLYGIGDHGGGPSRDMIERGRQFAADPVFPSIVWSRADAWFDTIRPKWNSFPVYTSELYLQTHRGTYTTQAQTKKNNRKSEFAMYCAEELSSVSKLLGGSYPKDMLPAWRKVLFNQFHDILPGSSIHRVYEDSAKDYKKVFDFTAKAVENGLSVVTSKIDTKGQGKPVVVFNPLSWKRSDLVTLDAVASADVIVKDSAGKTVPSQVKDGKLVFIASDIPSVGYRVYHLVSAKKRADVSTVKAGHYELENKYFRVKINPETGYVASIYDKTNKREVFKSEGNYLESYEDTPRDYDAWNVDADDMSKPTRINGLESVKLVENGPVRSTVRVTRKFGKSIMEQDVVLYSDIARIDFPTRVSWHENHTMLKVAFPFAVNADSATYEIPYAAIKRTTVPKTAEERAAFEVSGHKWADMSDSAYGVSLLNDCKYGYSADGSTLKLSLLRSPLSPDPEADRGENEFTYSLYPHTGSWQGAGTVRMAYGVNQPLMAKQVTAHPGKLPVSHSFLGVSSGNVILGAMKKAEDSNALIVRLYESTGKKTPVKISLPVSPKGAWETNLLEENLKKAAVKGGFLETVFGPYEIKTFKFSY